jgi:hypothetical protein
LACVLATELIFGVLAAVAIGPHPAAQPSSSVTSAPRVLAVGDRTLRMTNLGGAQSQLVLDRVAADIGQAVDAVDAFWGNDWPRDINVVATGTQRQFEAQAGGGPAAQWADIAAIAVADRVDLARRSATGQRIVFALGAAGMSKHAFRIVLSHELFHYAARAATAVDAPRWLTEGVADYVARPRVELPEVATPPTSLPSDADLAIPGPGRSQAYDRAWWFALFIADTRGPPTLRALYQEACGDGHTDLPTAVHDVLGTDTAGILADWQRWLTRGPAH